MGKQAPVDTSWFMAVIEKRGERIPLLAVQAEDGHYEGVRARLVKAGFSRLSRAEWERTAWPWSATSAVDVVGGRLIRFTTGTSSFYCGGEMPVGPLWLEAGLLRGQALIALLPCGWVADDAVADEVPDRVTAAAAARKLWAATGTFRVDLLKLSGPGWQKPVPAS